MTERDLEKYWRDTAKDSLDTAEGLFKLKRYHHALFFCHLSLEKILKGLVFVKTGQHALPIHDLVKLSHQAKLPLNNSQIDELSEIATFNVAARYDNIKRDFYHKATEDFATVWLNKTKEIFLWLTKQF